MPTNRGSAPPQSNGKRGTPGATAEPSRASSGADVLTQEAKAANGAELTGKRLQSQKALLAAARAVFERDGFHGARITAIAETAGMAHGSFYNYFESKEQIFRHVVGDTFAEMMDINRSVDEWSPGTIDVYEIVRAAHGRYLDAYRQHGRLFRLWEEVAAIDPEMHDLLAQSREVYEYRTARLVRKLQAAGLADATIDPTFAASALTGMVASFARFLEAKGAYFDFEDATRQLTIMWLNALGYRSDGAR